MLAFFNGRQRFGIGPALDINLFNQAGDNTRVYIMTPRRYGQNYLTSNYIGLIGQLTSTLQAALGKAVPIVLYNYIRLNYDDPADVRLINTQRGKALFQFDPTGYAGAAGWRLFYEHNQFASTDPTPIAAYAEGIPDQV